MNATARERFSWGGADGDVDEEVSKFDPDQPRDESGRWTDGPGGGAGRFDPAKPVRVPSDARTIPIDAMSSATRETIARDVMKVMDGNGKDIASWDVRREAKKESQARLSSKMMDLYPDVAAKIDMHSATYDYVNLWAETSGDHNPRAVAAQLAAAREFDLPDIEIGHLGMRASAEGILDGPSKYVASTYQGDSPTEEEVFRALVRSTYEVTQDFLRDNGIRSVPLARGAEYDTAIAEDADVKLQPLSSFATDVRQAMKFADMADTGTIHLMHVPADRVFSTPWTGVGCLPETEVVVLGGTYKGAFTIDTRHVREELSEMLEIYEKESDTRMGYKERRQALADAIQQRIDDWYGDELG